MTLRLQSCGAFQGDVGRETRGRDVTGVTRLCSVCRGLVGAPFAAHGKKSTLPPHPLEESLIVNPHWRKGNRLGVSGYNPRRIFGLYYCGLSVYPFGNWTADVVQRETS